MSDVLIRDVPDEDLERIDAEASRLGISRSTYLRREMHRIARHRTVPAATLDDLHRSRAAMADLDNDEVMGQAWS